VEGVWRILLANVRTPAEREGDLAAQLSALTVGTRRLMAMVEDRGAAEVAAAMAALIAYADRLVRAGLDLVPDGDYEAEDWLEDDGFGHGPLPIRVMVRVRGDTLQADFTGTSPQVEGGVNAVSAITESCVRYVTRCIVEALLGQPLPAGGGEMAAVKTVLPARSLVSAGHPAGVAAGNVETSQRIADVLLLAMARALPDLVPAQSQGTMNNLAIGGTDPRTGEAFAYYETMAGGMGAGPAGPGLSGVHVHMTNSLNTPVEALEHAYPLRILRYGLRHGTGGAGLHGGGDGVRRDVELLAPATVSLLTERRSRSPQGLAGGEAGALGENVMLRGGEESVLPAKVTFAAEAGDVISIRSPGGGGWGGRQRTGRPSRRPGRRRLLPHQTDRAVDGLEGEFTSTGPDHAGEVPGVEAAAHLERVVRLDGSVHCAGRNVRVQGAGEPYRQGTVHGLEFQPVGPVGRSHGHIDGPLTLDALTTPAAASRTAPLTARPSAPAGRPLPSMPPFTVRPMKLTPRGTSTFHST
jgi:N-methylhydantoinase B